MTDTFTIATSYYKRRHGKWGECTAPVPHVIKLAVYLINPEEAATPAESCPTYQDKHCQDEEHENQIGK